MTGNFQYTFLDPMIDQIADVLAIRKKALALYAEGKTLMSWTGEGSEGQREFVAPVESILAETRMFLKTKDPNRYGQVVRQTKVLRVG